MKKLIILLLIIVSLYGCEKNNVIVSPSIIGKYQAIYGTWETQSISYDSSGIKISKSTPYNKLVINYNLEYQVYMNLFNPIENGTIIIITQTNDKLEVYFAAKYPGYSSFAGSHIFGISNAILVSLTNKEMIFRSADSGSYTNLEYHFNK